MNLSEHLPNPAFVPLPKHAAACMVGGLEKIEDIYLIEPSAAHPGFYFLSHIGELGGGQDAVDYLTRPIRADFVESWLQAAGLEDPAQANWLVLPHEGVQKAGQSISAALEAA